MCRGVNAVFFVVCVGQEQKKTNDVVTFLLLLVPPQKTMRPDEDAPPAWWAPVPTAFGLRDGRPLVGGRTPRAAVSAAPSMRTRTAPLASLTAAVDAAVACLKLTLSSGGTAAAGTPPSATPLPLRAPSRFARLSGGTSDTSRPWWLPGGGRRKPTSPSATDSERVLVSDVVLTGVDDEKLLAAARSALTLKPNYSYTLGEVSGMEEVGDGSHTSRERGFGWRI